MRWVMSVKGYIAMWIHLNVTLCHSSSSISIPFYNLFQMSNVMMIHNCTIPFIVVVVGSGCGFSVWAVNSIEFLMSTQEGIEIEFDYVVSIYVRLFQLQANFFCFAVNLLWKLRMQQLTIHKKQNKHLTSLATHSSSKCLHDIKNKICSSSHLNMLLLLLLFFCLPKSREIEWHKMCKHKKFF